MDDQSFVRILLVCVYRCIEYVFGKDSFVFIVPRFEMEHFYGMEHVIGEFSCMRVCRDVDGVVEVTVGEVRLHERPTRSSF
ncbi:hypothetical protein A6E15_03870 [Natrinema saccharevitans]|uniref:Uncharacterized protein n=1 Tax=Natrinema saccharevitans TaxID=301967 RepID=A0A1S8AUF3_9EURY|nr:hypothetical protein A6E15_03870 [Natrinema saccharevitans]